jgi:ABC-2 type transport system permease protein
MKQLGAWIMKIKPLLVIVVVPIAFTIIFGGAMSPIFVNNIPIEMLDMDESTASRDIIEDFGDCPTFDVIGKADSTDQLKEDLLMGKIYGGIIIPEGFGKDVTDKTGAKALVLINGANTLIGNNLKLYAYKIFMEKNYELQVSDMQSGGMLPYSSEQYIGTLSYADRNLYNPQQAYFYYLFAGLLGVFIQQTYLNVLAPMLLKEKDRLKLLPLGGISRRIGAREMLPVIFQYAGFSFISSLSCLLIAHAMFAYPLKGSLLWTLALQLIFLVGLTGMALVLAAIFDNETHCTQFIMFLTIPTMLSCGYSWPEFMMAPGFANVMKLIWPLYYYYNPLKELMLKGATFTAIQDYVLGGLIFAAFWLPAAMWIYRLKIRTMKQIENI